MHDYPKMKQLRESNGLSQANIANVLEITQQQYQLYESGKREIPLHLMMNLAKFYNVSLDYITGLDQEQAGSEDHQDVI